MHITHEQFVESFDVLHPFLDSLTHTSRGTVGKRQARHICKIHTMFMCPNNTLGKHCRLTTAWRS